MEKEVLTVVQYGNISVKLNDLLKARGLTRNALSRATGVRFEVIDKWTKSKIERMDLDVLARICYVLDCQVSDLLEYSSGV